MNYITKVVFTFKKKALPVADGEKEKFFHEALV